MVTDNLKQELELAIQRLKQGLLTGQYRLTLEAHHKIFLLGQPAVKSILKELNLINLNEIERPEVISLAVGLASILHDLDEKISLNFLNESLNSPCHPSIKSAFRVIKRHKTTNYNRIDFEGIQIFESIEIQKKYNASKYIIRWLRQIPAKDRSGISRIYIVKAKGEVDYLGTYRPILSVITIIWDTFFSPYNPIYWLYRLQNKLTLYHEIGHHVHKHKEFGQDPEQEEEADTYAREIIKKNHPILIWVLKNTIGLIFWVIRKLFRSIVKKRQSTQ